MKTIFRDFHVPVLLAFALCLLLISSGCTKMADTKAVTDQNVSNAQAAEFKLGNFSQVNLNANKPGYHALHVDENLHNAWGLSASPVELFGSPQPMEV